MFASAFHLANLGRLPKFAIQPYRQAMREAFRKALSAEDDIEGLAATALLSVVFDVWKHNTHPPIHIPSDSCLTWTGYWDWLRCLELETCRL